MRKAEEIAIKCGKNKMAVISGVGVRKFYENKLGYQLESNYMVKYFPLVERINTKIITITNSIGYYNLIMILIIMLAIIVEYISHK